MGIGEKIRAFILSMADTRREGANFEKLEISKKSSKNDDTENGHYNYQIGEIISENFQIESLLGEGTFGKVLLCTDIDTNESSAVKVRGPDFL